MAGLLRNLIERTCVPLGWGAMIAAPFACHAAITTGRLVWLAIALSALQAAAIVWIALRQKGRWEKRGGLLVAAVLLVVLALKAVPAGEARISGLIASSGASHAIIYLSLLVLFGQSLRPGRMALVTRLALRVRGALTPAMHAYTRTVTKAWCVFFLAQLVISAVLLAFAPARVWSLFVNVLDGPLGLALFLGEYGVRRWRFRGDRHYSPFAAARSFVRDRAGG